MLTMNDITLTYTGETNPDAMILAFVIESEVVHIMHTYRSFYDLITSGYSVVEDENAAAENSFRVVFKNGEEIVETVECTELLSALLRSEPRVLVMLSEPKPPIEEVGIVRYVSVGWFVNENDEYIPPVGWVHPKDRPQLTEEQKEKIRAMGHKID